MSPSHPPSRTPLIAIIGIIALVCFILALCLYAYMGRYNVAYYNDDYAHCTLPHTLSGFIETQKEWYTGWTGIYTSVFFVSIACVIGSPLLPLLQTIYIILWGTTLTWTYYQLSALLRVHRPFVVSPLLATFTIFATLTTTPSLFQSFYWLVGSIEYTLPNIFLGASIGVIVYSMRHQFTTQRTLLLLSLATFILTFVAGGLAQTFVTMQTTLLILALLALYLVPEATRYRPGVVPLLLTGLVGSLLAMLLVVMALGNAVRQTNFTPTTDIFVLAQRSFAHSISFVYNIPRNARLEIPLVAFIALLVGMFAFPSPQQPATTIEDYRQSLAQKGVLIIWCVGIGFVLIMSALVPSIYGRSLPPPGRALIIPQFVFFCVVLCSSAIAGLMVRQVYPVLLVSRIAQTIMALFVVVLLIASPLRIAYTMYNLRTAAQAYANALNERERMIQQAIAEGRDSVVVPYLGYHPAFKYNDTLTANPSHWINQSVRDYYGITVTSDETIGIK